MNMSKILRAVVQQLLCQSKMEENTYCGDGASSGQLRSELERLRGCHLLLYNTDCLEPRPAISLIIARRLL
jgi:hypothetical protein